MALPILDGNQTSVTLATTVSGGAHYPNHIIASSVTIGSCVTHGVNVANSVTISSLPAISGTVTANVFGKNIDGSVQLFTSNDGGPRTYDGGGAVAVGFNDNINDNFAHVSTDRPFPIQGTVTIGNSVTIGSLPDVTVSNVILGLEDGEGDIFGRDRNFPVTIVDALPSGGNNIGNVGIITALPTGNNRIGFVTITAGISQIGSVTISALPSGALTTRFGSVTTANTAQITTSVTNTSRKYLLAQNISTGTVTIGIGFSPTTTQGIQLTAGAGLTFDSFVPTGAVYWLGATTGAAYTILEG